MLNEEKIRLMVDVALFEKTKGTKMAAITSYFKRDYISRHMIRGFLSYTFCAVLLVTFWGIFNMDVFLNSVGTEALFSLAKKVGVLLAAGLAVYLILIYFVYGKRYDDAVRLNRIYVAKLKHLDKRYECQRRMRELAREGRRV